MTDFIGECRVVLPMHIFLFRSKFKLFYYLNFDPNTNVRNECMGRAYPGEKDHVNARLAQALVGTMQ